MSMNSATLASTGTRVAEGETVVPAAADGDAADGGAPAEANSMDEAQVSADAPGGEGAGARLDSSAACSFCAVLGGAAERARSVASAAATASCCRACSAASIASTSALARTRSTCVALVGAVWVGACARARVGVGARDAEATRHDLTWWQQ